MKSKKVLTILLALAIMVTFMPTMAFAATTPVTGSHSNDDVLFANLDSVDVDTEGLKVLVAPTCDKYGAGELTCDIEINGEACGAVRTVKINPLNHQEAGDRVRLKADQIMDLMGFTDLDKEIWHGNNPEKCEGYVTLCKECGQPIYKRSATSRTWRLLSGSRDWTSHVEWTAHTEPTTGLAKCDKYFTCTVCNYEYSEDADHNANTYKATGGHLEGALHTEDVYKHVIKNKDGEDEKRVKVTKTYCEECGFVEYSDPVAQKYDKPKNEWKNEGNLKDFNHSKTTRVVTTAATCMNPGEYEDVCDDCGYVVTTGTIEKTPHVYETKIYDDGTYYWTGQFCAYCGVRKPGTEDTRIDFVPNDVKSLSYSEIAPANCEQGSFVLATYKVNDTEYKTVMSDEDVLNDATIVKVGDKYYDSYVDGEGATKRVEVPFTEALKHDFGQIVKFAEATCTEAAVEAKVCSKCNKVDHATVQHVGQPLGHDITTVTVAATCGAEGYSYNTCGRCKLFVSKDGKKTYEADELELAKFDKVAPVVSLGTPCQFEWGDLDENTEAEICKVCGAVKAGTETPKTEEKKAQEAREAAKPVIGAAADITNDAANYKASSIKAIEEAKKNLDTAIYAGSADQIRQATAELQAAVDAAAKKDANTMTAKGKTVKANARKTTKFSAKKAFTVKNAKGKVTYKKKSGNSKVKVASNGKVTVKKGLKKGKTYKVKVTVKAAGNGDYLAKTKTVTLKVKVK
jgi:hypothetical protein